MLLKRPIAWRGRLGLTFIRPPRGVVQPPARRRKGRTADDCAQRKIPVPLVLGSTMRLSGLGEGAEGRNDRAPPGRSPRNGADPRGPLGTPGSAREKGRRADGCAQKGKIAVPPAFRLNHAVRWGGGG